MELFYGSGSDNSKLDSLRGGSESGFLEYPCYYLKNYWQNWIYKYYFQGKTTA